MVLVTRAFCLDSRQLRQVLLFFSIFFLRTGLYGNSFYRLFYDTLMVGLNSAIIH